MYLCCIKRQKLMTQTLLHAVAQHSRQKMFFQKTGVFQIPLNQVCRLCGIQIQYESFISYQKRQEHYMGTYFSIRIISVFLCLVRFIRALSRQLQRLTDANVFEPAYMTSFVGNVCVIQASVQLHCWARCVQNSLQTNS